MPNTHILLPVLFLLFLSQSLFAQRTISGTVTEETGDPLIGASVFIQGTGQGTATDMKGKYELSLPLGARFLVFSYTGYATREVEIGAKNVLDVTLRLSAAFLEEVIVTGVAVGTPTTKIGFNVAKVNEDQLKETPGVNAAVALQSKVPGVIILSPGGLPGSSPSIRIRGADNLYGYRAPPLIIVDGMQLQEPSNLADIQSEDIKSIEVLKGAAATSLYGSRAGNGVISIITKRGSDQVGVTEISLRNEFGQSSLPRQIDMATHHPYVVNPNGSVNYGQVDDDHFVDNEYPQLHDQQARFFDPGSYMTNTLSVSSRSQSTNYFFSLNNTRQSGVIRFKDGYSRQSARINVDHKINKVLKLSLSSYYTQSQNDEPLRRFGPGSTFFHLVSMPPAVDLTEPNEEDGSPYNWNAPLTAGSNNPNPLYLLANEDYDEQVERYSSSFGLKITPMPALALDLAYAIDRRTLDTEVFVDKGYLAVQGWAAGRYTRSSGKRAYQTATGKLTFKRALGELELTSQGAVIYEDDSNKFFGVTAYDFRFEGLRSLNNSGTLDPGTPGSAPINRTQRSSNDFQIRTLNYYLTGAFDWKDKLILDGLVRFDGSSLFGSENRWNTFYRASLAYRLTQDVNIPQVQEIKLRASYGAAGSRPGFEYRFESLTANGDKQTLGNKDLRPSLKEELEVGLDARIANRISFTLNYAHTIARDLFYQVPLPAAAGGFSFQWQNIDSRMEHRSLEATLGLDVIRGRAFRLSADLIFDRMRSKITRFDFPDLIQYIFLMREGLSYRSFYMHRFARRESDLFPQQRQGKTFAVNSEGWLVEAEKLGAPDERPILVVDETGNTQFLVGDVNPDFNLGFNLKAGWKQLQVYALFHWKQGGEVYNVTRQRMIADLRHGDVDQAGRAPADKKPFEYYSTFVNNDPNNYFLEDASYLKLRELAVSYTLKPDRGNALGKVFKGIKLSVIGRNLFTLANYTGYDPEVGVTAKWIDASIMALDDFAYPNFRTISGALECKF